MPSEKQLDAIRFALIFCYSVIEGLLLGVSLGVHELTMREQIITNIEDLVETIINVEKDVAVNCAIFPFVYLLFNKKSIENLFDREDGTRLAFVQTFITIIFTLSFMQAPVTFYIVCLYWCIISPIGILLSAGAYLVPYIRNKIVNVIIGVISTAIGFASKFCSLPLMEPIKIILTVSGALLTVIGIGTPKDKARRQVRK